MRFVKRDRKVCEEEGKVHKVEPYSMYMANHDIVLIALIATPTNWTRHRAPVAPPMSGASGTAHTRESRDRTEKKVTYPPQLCEIEV